MTIEQILSSIIAEYELRGLTSPNSEISSDLLMLRVTNIDVFFEVINSISDNIKITGIWKRGFNLKISYEKRN